MWCPLCKSDYPEGWKRCPTDETPLLRGPTIGKYKIEKVIGSGGMGAVYRAVNPDTESSVALKLLHASAAGVEAARVRFQREAAAIAALKTRHVVSIFDFGAEADGTLYLVMELLIGHTLRQEIAAPPHAMPLPRVNLVLDGALRGLGAAHRAGIVHRDLKPENVFIAETDDGETAKLLDFGIARKGQGSGLTHSGALMGTPAYMAPEQVAGNRGDVGPWSDVYGMGVILYEMLAGTAPFHADSLTEVLSRVLARQFEPLREVRRDLPEAIYRLCDRALADDPRARFPHGDALREAWTAAFAELPTEVKNATVPRFRALPVDSDHLATAPTSAPTGATAPTAASSRAPGTVTTASGVAVAAQEEPARGVHRGVAIGLGGAVAVAGALALLVHRGGGGAAHPPDAAAAPLAQVDAAPRPIDAGPPPGMVRLPGGTFTMGTGDVSARRYPNAIAARAVTVAPFRLDVREVTAAELRRALGEPVEGSDADLPARAVTWTDADRACRALGKRLPSEAEWEYAAQRSPLSAEGAQLKRPGTTGPAPVGSHPGDCTTDGVCDLLGNVMEWTADGAGATRIARGADFTVSPSARWFATIHARSPAPVDRPDPEIGFRCAADGAP